MTIGQQVSDALRDIDLPAAVRVAFGKCPKCSKPMVRGEWLKWCPDRTCEGYVGPA